MNGPKRNSEFASARSSTLRSRCFLHLPTQMQKKLLLQAGRLINLPRFRRARPEHVRVESSCCCFPRELVSFVRPGELVSFKPRHVARFPSLGKRIWVGRYSNLVWLHEQRLSIASVTITDKTCRDISKLPSSNCKAKPHPQLRNTSIHPTPFFLNVSGVFWKIFLGRNIYAQSNVERLKVWGKAGNKSANVSLSCLNNFVRDWSFKCLLMLPLDSYPPVNRAIHKTLNSLGNIVDVSTLPLVVLYELHTPHISPLPETRNARIEITTISSWDKEKTGQPEYFNSWSVKFFSV